MALINPVTLRDPLSPHLAAAHDGVQIAMPPMRAAFEQLAGNHQRVVVEGVGGWMVPLAPGLLASDIARQWRLPVILVVGLRLGCLSHALLTARAIQADGCALLGWIGNAIDPAMEAPEENIATLRELLPAPCLGVLPHGLPPAAGGGPTNGRGAGLGLSFTSTRGSIGAVSIGVVDMARNHYYLSIADLAHARGNDPRFAYDGAGPNDFAAALQASLRGDALFERWRAAQPDPDAVDAGLAVTDPAAEVGARVADLHTDVDLVTDLPMSVVRHRSDLLIGSAWQLRDMRAV